MFRRWFVGLTMVVGIFTIPLLGTGSNAAEIKVFVGELNVLAGLAKVVDDLVFQDSREPSTLG